MRRPHPTEAGFTLIEAVMVIAITGVVIGLVAIFIAPATTAYFASSTRAKLGDEADTALRRITRDLAAAPLTGISSRLVPVMRTLLGSAAARSRVMRRSAVSASSPSFARVDEAK
jgi:type II secretory pathway component PulJ